MDTVPRSLAYCHSHLTATDPSWETALESPPTSVGPSNTEAAGLKCSTDSVGAQVTGYLWGLPGYDSLQNVDWAKASPASLSAWLTTENVLQMHPNRVLRSSSATTALVAQRGGNNCLLLLLT